MISQAESSKALTEINGANRVFSNFHKVKDLLTQAANNLPEKTQQAKASLVETADKAADKVTTIAQQAKASVGENIDKTKDSVEQTLQTVGHAKDTTSQAIQLAINSSVNDWIQAHPVASRLLQLLAWVSDRPILSLVIFLFTLAIAWRLIKSVGSLFEKFLLALLQLPLKLGKFLLQVSFQSLGKFSNLIIKQSWRDRPSLTSDAQNLSFESTEQNNKRRLLEISNRLAEIRQEQNELLQEIEAILNSESFELENCHNERHEQLLFKP
ncbi:MAG TPA: hypothetical protein DEV81_05800 [Cyanobacteria bacterium UBA11049]|nr:hypothetical protein [Cyanobacteria bacterium UBA11049]